MSNYKFFAIIAAFFAVYVSAPAYGQTDATKADDDIELLVPVPQPDKSIIRLDERCNYILYHFWDNFNFKNAFSARKRFEKTFGTFLEFTPYATADTVHLVLDRMIKDVAKAKPQMLLDLCEIAESYCHGDSAEYASDELYYPFVEAVVTNKKAKGPTRARFEAQYRQLQNSRVGSDISGFTFTRPDGTTMKLGDVSAPHVLLMFVDPECVDCRLAKARLSADFVISAFVKNDILDIVTVYPGEATDGEWASDAASMPEGWITGANPEADLDFEIPQTPTIYYAYRDDNGVVVKAKNVRVDNVLNAFHSIMENAGKNNAEPDFPTQTDGEPAQQPTAQPAQ